MKTTVFHVLTTALLGLGLTSIAHAGARDSNSDLYINPEHRTASGVVSGVRNTPDTLARIECGITASPESISMFCLGRNASGLTATCASSRPPMVQAAAAIQSDSFIQFSWNEGGECTFLQTMVQSAAAPKQP